MKILGVDPGSLICGYGVIEKINTKLIVIEYGEVNLVKKNEDFNLRLKDIFIRLNQVIERTKPDMTVFESAFYKKNVQSLVKLTQAKAAAILPAVLAELPVIEYSPREIKKSVTGNGNASKEQVEYMVKKILNFNDETKFFDSTDALAVAICHANKLSSNFSVKKTNNWKEFIKANPEKVIKR